MKKGSNGSFGKGSSVAGVSFSEIRPVGGEHRYLRLGVPHSTTLNLLKGLFTQQHQDENDQVAGNNTPRFG